MRTAAQLLFENGEKVTIKIDQDQYISLFRKFTKGKGEPRPIRFEETGENKEVCGRCGSEPSEEIILYLRQFPSFSYESILHFIATIQLVLAHEISHSILFSNSIFPIRSLLHNACQKLLEWHYKASAYFIPRAPRSILWVATLSLWVAKQIRRVREAITEALTQKLLKSYPEEFVKIVTIENQNL